MNPRIRKRIQQRQQSLDEGETRFIHLTKRTECWARGMDVVYFRQLAQNDEDTDPNVNIMIGRVEAILKERLREQLLKEYKSCQLDAQSGFGVVNDDFGNICVQYRPEKKK